MDLNDVQAFVAVGKALSFSAAGRTLGVPKSTLSKQLRRLEQRLGVRLLQRTTRTVALTETGAAYLECCQRAIEDIENAERVAMEVSSNPRGELRVAASFDVARDVLSPLLAEFHARYPHVSLRLVIDQCRVDLIADGFDVALRGGPQADASLVARLLQRVELVICASPDYLKARGRPTSVAELAGHDVIMMQHPACAQLLGSDGPSPLQAGWWLVANEWGVLRRALVEGLGIGLLPQQLWQADIESGRLERILPDVGLMDGLYAVYPSRHHLSRKVRVFVDYLSEKISR
jgi:DNA-binding transcriptional LysR family regulator